MPSFLPQYPLPPNPLLLFGFLLLAGVLGGEVAARVLAVPRIVGYVLIGLLLGAGGLGVLDAGLIKEAWIFVELALGLILFELGRRMDFTWLKRDAWLAATGLLESALTFWLLFFVLTLFEVGPLYAAVAAAIGIATSPAVVMVIAQGLKAEGQVTERALNLTVMNSVISFIVVTMLLAAVHHEYRAAWMTVVLHPVYLLLGSAFLGLVASVLAVGLARWLGKSGGGHFVMTLSLIVMTVGAARLLELSVVLAILTFGVLSRNLDRRHDVMAFDPGRLGQTFVVVLFVVSGASLRVDDLVTGGTLAVAFILTRLVAKSLGIMSLTRFSGVRPGTAGMLCLALTPMSALGISMVRSTTELYPAFGEKLAAIVLSAVLILELLGPIAVDFALRRAGEAVSEEKPAG